QIREGVSAAISVAMIEMALGPFPVGHCPNHLMYRVEPAFSLTRQRDPYTAVALVEAAGEFIGVLCVPTLGILSCVRALAVAQFSISVDIEKRVEVVRGWAIGTWS